MTIDRAVPRWASLPAALGVVLVSLVVSIQAQTPAGSESLRAEVEARYRVTPISGGIGLMPRDTTGGFALIELRGGTVAIDGAPVSGQELAERLGADAGLILQLTYLDPETQLSQLGLTRPVPVESTEPADPIAPIAPVAPVAPVVPFAPAVEAEDTGTRERDRRLVHRDRVSIGGRVHVRVDELVRGDIVMIGGSLVVDGEVQRDITVIGGSVEFGPEAIARREVTVIGGRLTRAPTARFLRGR